jgi:hypothetical protein
MTDFPLMVVHRPEDVGNSIVNKGRYSIFL